jgi:hypothetical protein
MRLIKSGWVEEYLRWIKATSESPNSYHYWSAASVIAGAVKRNCWINRGDYNLYPNIFCILVGHTGLGKGRAINPAVGLLREAGCANILSDKLTIQYILEKISDRGLAAAHAQITGATGGTITISTDASCFISAPEVEDLLTASDAMPSLKELWECKDGPFEYGTRGKGLVKIAKPCPTLLGGCTPSQIALLFPNHAVGGGFVRRVSFVYEPERSQRIPWPLERNGNDPVRDALINDLRHIAQLRGVFRFDPVAAKMFTDYYNSSGCDEFADEATSSYDTSRPFHAMKLAMCLALARSDTLIINFLDMAHAIQMVNKCSDDLRRVFRAVGDSEAAAIMDKVLRFIEIRSKVTYVTHADLMGALWRDVGSTQNLDVILATLEAGRIIATTQKANLTTYHLVKVKPPTNYTVQ